MTLEDFLHGYGSSLPLGTLWAAGVALLAGMVASAVCPCTLPVGLGVASVVGSSAARNRRDGFWIAVAFFAGMVSNLTLLGVVAGRLGAILTESFGRYWALSMVVISFAAAVAALWVPRLNTDSLAALRRPGLAGTFMYGFIFSLGTSAAPLLLLLTVAAAQARSEYGFILAFAFGIGRGLPFLLAGLFAGVLMRFTRLGSWQRAIQILSAGALVFVGAYYVRVFVALL